MTIEPVKVKRCPLCAGELREDTASLPFVGEGCVIGVKDVPAEVCNDCGEAFLQGDITDKVTELLRDAVRRRVELTGLTLQAETLSPA